MRLDSLLFEVKTCAHYSGPGVVTATRMLSSLSFQLTVCRTK